MSLHQLTQWGRMMVNKIVQGCLLEILVNLTVITTLITIQDFSKH